jgi:hypothetical protein
MGRMRWLMILAAGLVASCGIEEVSRRPGAGRDDVWTGPGMNVGSSGKEVSYVTAFAYPEGYDWKTDREKGSVKCSLTVFADGIPMMKIPVGDEYEVSSDPDMHRMLEGHLYTDYSTDSETVIKRDGKTVIRYPGREMICGIIADGEDVYTLGHPRKGEGFAYRKNGEVILQRSVGRSFGRLYRDDASICFSFCEPVVSSEETLERYYHVRDGEVSQEALREDVRKVWDMVSVGGEISYIASVTGIERPVLCKEGELSALILPRDSTPLSINMMAYGESVFFKGVFTSAEITLASAIWFRPGHCVWFDDGMTASSCCISGDGICCTFNPKSSSDSGRVYRFGDMMQLPSGYAVMGEECAAVARGILHIGLSSLEGGKPAIWQDGDVRTLDVNGFVASVSTH